MKSRCSEAVKLRDGVSPSLGRPFPVFFVRFRALFFRQMIKNVPRLSSPKEQCTRPSDAKEWAVLPEP
eukprot:9426870-Pyramimonas_sp.AAC.1